MDNFGCLNSSLPLFYLYFVIFCKEPAKKEYGVRTLTAEPSPPPMRASTLVTGPPLPPSERTYFMYDP